MQDAVINLSRTTYVGQLITGEPVQRFGNSTPVHLATAPGNLYPCKPGGPNDYCYIYTTRAGNQHWFQLLNVIGRTDLKEDPRFSSPETRFANREIVDGIVSAWTRQLTKQEVMDRLGSAGVPAGATLTTKELINDDYLRSRKTFVEVEHPQRGKFAMPGCAIKMSRWDPVITAAPLLGRDTDRVLTDLLDLTAPELEALRLDGTI